MNTARANLPEDVGALLDAQDPGARARLGGVVRAALGAPEAVPLAWGHAALPAGYGPATAGTFRVTGTARVAGATVPWAAVLKVLRAPAPGGGGHGDAARWDHWQREALVYRSGVAAGVPGGFAPARCLGVDAGAREARVWLELLVDDEPGPWAAARLRLAARHLGRFQGAFLGGRPLPRAPWLARDWLRGWVGASAPNVARLAAMRGHPLVERGWPGPLYDGVLRIWEEREAFFAALERLPRTLLHGDVNARNLFSRAAAGRSGEAQTVAIDWSFTGAGAIGEDLVPLARGAVREGLPPAAVRALVLEGYADGLRDTGWRGDAEALRLAYCAAAALRYGFHLYALACLDDANREPLERRLRATAEQALDLLQPFTRLGVACAREARTLLGLGAP